MVCVCVCVCSSALLVRFSRKWRDKLKVMNVHDPLRGGGGGEVEPIDVRLDLATYRAIRHKVPRFGPNCRRREDNFFPEINEGCKLNSHDNLIILKYRKSYVFQLLTAREMRQKYLLQYR